MNYQGKLEASEAIRENGTRLLLAALFSFPGSNKINQNPSARPCLGGYRDVVQRGVRGRRGGGGSAIKITNNTHTLPTLVICDIVRACVLSMRACTAHTHTHSHTHSLSYTHIHTHTHTHT